MKKWVVGKKPEINKLKKSLSKLVHDAAMVRYGEKCCWCGDSGVELEAHHWIHTRGASGKWQYDLDNISLLCVPCHRFGVHGLKSVDIEFAMLRHIDKERINYIREHNEPYRFSVEELREIEESIRRYIEKGGNWKNYQMF